MRARGLLKWAKGLTARTFRERQVFLRTGGSVRFVTLSRRRQVAAAGLLAVLVVWSLYVSAIYFSHDARLSASDAKIAEMRLAYERLVAERDLAEKKTQQAYRALIDGAIAGQGPSLTLGELRSESQYELSALRARNAVLARQVTRLQDDLTGVRAERDRLATAEGVLARQRDFLDGQLAVLKQQSGTFGDKIADLQAQLKNAETRYGRLGQVRDRLASQLDDARGDAADLRSRNEDATTRIAALESSLAAVTSERDRMAQERGALDNRVGGLEQHLAALQADQKALIARLSARAVNSSQEVEHTIAMTGLDVNRLLVEAGKAAGKPHLAKIGTGGPFVAFRPGKKAGATGKSSARSAEIERVVLSLERQEERREGLRWILARLPLASPVDNYHVASDFGPRIDPINGRLALHQGVDLTAGPHAPVLASASGTVVFAGWSGGYGRMVEIDHGLGIHTRYAHLRKILVQQGRKVAAHAQIGVIGDSGRSTGTHVHYEILVDGQPRDPMKFMKAGEYVYSKN
jgi:murein DD-endopeptidase MepM/ murein hydrolase activator NlpD